MVFVLCFLADPLCRHCVRNLKETRNIGACHIVSFHSVLLRRIVQVMEDIHHNVLQFAVHFLKSPAKTLGVLAHLQCGSSHAACIRRLTGCKQHAVCL